MMNRPCSGRPEECKATRDPGRCSTIMRLRDDELIGLPVETASGVYVGRLVGFVVDMETGFVVQYRVCPRGFVAACFPGFRELLIAHDQVVSIDTKRMIVRDGAQQRDGQRQRERILRPMEGAGPATSQIE